MNYAEKIFFTGFVALICLGMCLSFVCRSFKILEQTKNRLIFQIQPTFSWTISTFFSGIALIAILFSLTIPPLTILKCTHSYPQISAHQPRFYTNCELVAINWLGREQNKTLIPELRAALLEAKLDGDNSSSLFDRYRVLVVSEQGNIPLTESYISSFEPEYQYFLTVVSQINSFIEKSLEDSLTIELEERLLGYTGFAIGSFFGLLALLIVAIAPYIICSFDQEFNLVTIERRNLFGKKRIEYKTSDIIAVKVEGQSDEESASYRLNIILTSGEKLPLTYVFTSGWKEKQQIAARLQNFLGIGDLKADL